MFAVKYMIFFACLIKSITADFRVQTSSGPILGVASLSGGVGAFLGVPFAEPPVGDLRFAKPVPKQPWTEILNASKISSPCTQISLGDVYYAPDISNMSEDCLYLNIWAPRPFASHKLRPIIIFLHPGEFLTGATNFHGYDGSYLSRQGGVIVVTTNYRLGAFGFLLANIEEANGNMAMYDQLMAIKWMKENALAFGGNPDNIVLMGNDVGALSISLHMISPISKPLFHKAIIQSGSGVNPFTYDINSMVFQSSESVATSAGCANDTVNLKTNPRAVISCLKRQPMDVILKASSQSNSSDFLLFFPRSGDEFLPESPAELIADNRYKADIPVLTGITSDEGTLLVTTSMREQYDIYGKNISPIITKDYVSQIAKTNFEALNVSNVPELLKYYISMVEDETPVGYSKMLADMYGDYSVSCGTIFQADFFSTEWWPVYFYVFDARSRNTPFAEWMGVTHMEELQFIFGISFHGEFTPEDVRLSNHLMRRWGTFAKTGNPTGPGQTPWNAYSYKYPRYLRIQYRDRMISAEPIERCRVWRSRLQAEIAED